MRIRRMFGMFGVLAAAAAVVAAQDDKAPSGTKPGDVIPSPFRAYLVVDDRFPPKVTPPVKTEDRDPRDRTNKMHCLVCENGLNPMIAVFVRSDLKTAGATAGVERLAQAMDRLIPAFRGDKLSGFIMFLRLEGVAKDFENAAITTSLKNPDDTKTGVAVTYGKTVKLVTITDPKGTKEQTELGYEYPDDEKRDAHAADVRSLAGAVKAPTVPFGLAPVKSVFTDAWGIGPDDDVTVVIYFRYRVAKRWVFKAPGPTDEQVREISAGVEEMITGEPTKK
jgi:hypothetical protein